MLRSSDSEEERGKLDPQPHQDATDEGAVGRAQTTEDHPGEQKQEDLGADVPSDHV